ncbi:tyrosine-type recombinase/integrase [Candidatus Bathyarchaeota archaeon]|nr:tyrosine-type recombinase/integrase [Candidatus Bathyarchaeota archaeon]MBS7618481.1 tyrosine-type recombinase/integrase [Candidatus Bathyarchaeota archaeon]
MKKYIAERRVSDETKENYVDVYNNLLKSIGGSWAKPSYKRIERLPFIPTEEEIDQLIAGCGKKTSALLHLLKETGIRVGEALRLKWTDVDFKRRVASITSEKGSRVRILPITPRDQRLEGKGMSLHLS